MSDVIYSYYLVNLSKKDAVNLGYLDSGWLSKMDYEPCIKGRICVRIQRPPLNTQGEQIYRVSYSFCSPSDNFNRKLARAIASGKPQLVIKSNEPLKVNDVSNMAITYLKDACVGERSAISVGQSRIKIPNWFSLTVGKGKGEMITPEWRKR